MMQAEILSVGDEVVSGQVADTNAAWLSQRLFERGIPVAAHAAVGDDGPQIQEAVLRAAGQAVVVVVTGGLGPTHDDVTREALAAAAGAELVLHPPALEHIERLFARRGLTMPDSNRKQATIPAGADVLANTTGTAAGFRLPLGGAFVFALPGVPAEMRAMFENAVVPLLPSADGACVVRMFRCFGLSESIIAETLGAEIDLHGDPKTAFLASGGVITVKFVARAETADAARVRIEPVLRKARSLLGDAVFGEDHETLEEAVARGLAEAGKTIAIAESCTGGLVAGRLTNVPGISECFVEGVVAYSNAAKERRLGVPGELFETTGAVGEDVARAMAEGVRERAGTDLGVGVTGIAGPTGGTPEKPVGTVHLAVASAEGTVHRKYVLRGGRAQVRDRAVKHALDLVRRVLAGLPARPPGRH
jgi:nicotinamide-nucleotide amidase